MTPIKVEQTEVFKDATGDHIVCRGKLVLIKELSQGQICPLGLTNSDEYTYKPIIISETEEIKVGDAYFDRFKNEIRTAQLDLDEKTPYFKVLATPDQFSPEHLQFIAEGKLNNQDQVIVECWIYSKRVKLTDGHIKLLPLKWKNQITLDEEYSGPPDNSKYILQEVIQTHQEKVAMYSKLPKEDLIEMLIECNRILESKTGPPYTYQEYDLGDRKLKLKEYTMFDPNSNNMEVIENGYKCKECNKAVSIGGSCAKGCSKKPGNLIIDIIERSRPIHAIIDKFKNGPERMRTSALFNQTIHALAHGKEPLEIIEQLITITEDTQKNVESHINSHRCKAIVVPGEKTLHDSAVIEHFRSTNSLGINDPLNPKAETEG